MKPIQDIIALYFNAWNAETHEETARLLAQCCAPELAYVDPIYTHRSPAELADRIASSRVKFPGSRVDVVSAIDGYGVIHRYAWVFVAGEQTLPGIDVIERDGEGRIAKLVSFFGALEEIAAGAPLRVQPPFVAG